MGLGRFLAVTLVFSIVAWIGWISEFIRPFAWGALVGGLIVLFATWKLRRSSHHA
jgi:hypothetical protein